jgi:hypothetical protein
MTVQRVRVRSVPLRPALITGAWAGFVPGLFAGAIIGTLITFGAGAAIEWMRELSFTTGIQQQLLPFGDRVGLLQTLQDAWWLVIIASALVIGVLSAIIGMLTAALVASSFGSLLGGVDVEVEVEPVAEAEPKPAAAAARKHKEEYKPAVGDS